MGVIATFIGLSGAPSVELLGDGTLRGHPLVVERLDAMLDDDPVVSPIPAWDVVARSPWGFMDVAQRFAALVDGGPVTFRNAPLARTNAPADLTY